ncbi:MAG: DUF2784 domain-containing protein [Burkholderiales bacterium]|nr:DUF2784 domain-containing protein [Burkholderiales bacterium]
MLWRVLADAVVLAHLAFIAFAVAGGLLVLRRPRWAWLHLPAIAWVIWLELAGASCPLTVLENAARARAGQAGYGEGFIAHYLLPVIYPAGLTPAWQTVLGLLALALAVVIYAIALHRRPGRAGSGHRAAPSPHAVAAEDWR